MKATPPLLHGGYELDVGEVVVEVFSLEAEHDYGDDHTDCGADPQRHKNVHRAYWVDLKNNTLSISLPESQTMWLTTW